MPAARTENETRADPAVALVTGSTSGIGHALAFALAQMGYHVLLHGRDPARGASVQSTLQRTTRNPLIDLHIADLATKTDVFRLADEVGDRGRLDLLVHNAGVYHPKRQETPDGIEATFAVNHLAPFILTERLRPLLEAHNGARIVTVSSRAHLTARLHAQDLEMKERRYVGWLQYCNTKLMNLLWTRRLATTFDPAKVTANTFHPGLVRTGLARETSLIDSLFLMFGRNPVKGADTGVWLATDPALEGRTDRYFAHRRPAYRTKQAQDDRLATALWDASIGRLNG